MMFEVRIERYNVSDETCEIVEWLCENGQLVEKGDEIVVIETSKASMNLETEESGVIYRFANKNETCHIADVIARIFNSEEEHQKFLVSSTIETLSQQEVPIMALMTITNKAQKLIDAHNITEKDLVSIGKNVIKASDIKNLIESRDHQNNNVIIISKQQLKVAKTVTISRQTIPWGFLIMKVRCDIVLNKLYQISEEQKIKVGLLEYLVKICAELRSQFPLFFGKLQDESTFLPASEANIGVTLDVGKGLFIPVIKNAESLTLTDITKKLVDYEYKAFCNEFNEEDLMEGNFSISLMNINHDIIMSIPVIVPFQTGMLSLPAVYEELVMHNGEITVQKFINLGLAYDHRVINGRNATEFCEVLKTRIESPENVRSSESDIRLQLEMPYVPPQTEREKLIASIWQEVLKIEQIGLNDNFFKLGGNSFMSLTIISKLKKQGIKIFPAQFLQNPTIASLTKIAETQ